jgi:predicted DCC family thiol-disulfide oxidoreductase YuxK
MFLNCSTCFGRHTVHHQKVKNSKTASGFTYVFGCRPLQWPSHRRRRQPTKYVKLEAAFTVFELLMMSGLSLKTCWAIKKHWNNKFYYTVASCLFFLWDLYYDARIHEHQVEVFFLSRFRFLGFAMVTIVKFGYILSWSLPSTLLLFTFDRYFTICSCIAINKPRFP